MELKKTKNIINLNYFRKKLGTKNIISIVFVLLRMLIIISVGYIILFPLLVKLPTSFMTEADLLNQRVKWIPRTFTFSNFKLAWRYLSFPRAFLNSFTFASIISILQAATAALVGYGFARFNFRGKNILFMMVILTLVVPPETILIPLYLNFRYFDLYGLLGDKSINLLKSIWPFVLPALTGTGMRNGLFIFIMRQFFKGMPKELEEAAYVDGAGRFKTFSRVMLPGAGPAILIVFLFGFVWIYNDTQFVSTFWGDLELLSLNLSNISNFINSEDFEMMGYFTYGPYTISILLNACMLLFITPLIIMYIFLQRYFVESVQRTGIVG